MIIPFIFLWCLIVFFLVIFIILCTLIPSDGEFVIGAFFVLVLMFLSVGATTTIENNKPKYSTPTNFKIIKNKKDVVYTCDEIESKIFTDIQYINPTSVKIKTKYNFYGFEINKEYYVE